MAGIINKTGTCCPAGHRTQLRGVTSERDAIFCEPHEVLIVECSSWKNLYNWWNGGKPVKRTSWREIKNDFLFLKVIQFYFRFFISFPFPNVYLYKSWCRKLLINSTSKFINIARLPPKVLLLWRGSDSGTLPNKPPMLTKLISFRDYFSDAFKFNRSENIFKVRKKGFRPTENIDKVYAILSTTLLRDRWICAFKHTESAREVENK